MAESFSLGAMYWIDPHRTETRIRVDFREIRANSFQTIRLFVFWEEVEEHHGKFDFSRLDRAMAAAAEVGLDVVLSFGAYQPTWLRRKMFEAGIDDRPLTLPCLDRPENRRELARFFRATVEHFRHAPALRQWNIWNEPAKPPCRCPATLDRFAAWLKRHYGTIEALRAAWLGEAAIFRTECPESFAELTGEWLHYALEFGSRGRCTPLGYDSARFAAEDLREHFEFLGGIVRELDPGRPLHTNLCCIYDNPAALGVDEWLLGDSVDVLSISIHPCQMFPPLDKPANYHYLFSFGVDMIRSAAAGKPVWIGELQAGTAYHHWAPPFTPSPEDIEHYLCQAVGRGLDGLLFWEWQSWRSSMKEAGGFSLRRPHDGGPTIRSEAAGRIGRFVTEHHAEIASARRLPAQVAILAAREESILKMLQCRKMPDCRNAAREAAYGIYKAVARAGIAADFITENQIACENVLSRYKILLLPNVEIMRKDIAGAIAAFVREGGALWGDGRCAFLDEFVFLRETSPGHGLNEVFGADEADFVALGDANRIERPGRPPLKAFRYVQYLAPSTGEAAGFHAGRPVLVRNRYGKGTAVLVGSCLAFDIQRNDTRENLDYIEEFLLENGAEPAVKITPVHTFEVSRITGTECDVIAVTATSPGKAAITVPAGTTEVVSSGPDAVLTAGKIELEFTRPGATLLICRK